ncbi:leucine transcriptional activator [Vibrio alginolyticus 12G01]|nr:leucine transcriptional activator [Vibrio alginolyticus 12G01]
MQPSKQKGCNKIVSKMEGTMYLEQRT